MPESGPSDDAEVLERLEEEILFLTESLATASGQLAELAYELDDQLAEGDFGQVGETVGQLEGILGEEAAGDLVSLARLCAVRDGHPESDDGRPSPVPTLTADDLPSFVPDEEQDEDDARIDNLREREVIVADHLRALLRFVDDRFGWARTAAEGGKIGWASSELGLARKATAEALHGYELWMRCLNDLYLVSPSSLGGYGEMLMSFESFLQAEYPGHANGV